MVIPDPPCPPWLVREVLGTVRLPNELVEDLSSGYDWPRSVVGHTPHNYTMDRDFMNSLGTSPLGSTKSPVSPVSLFWESTGMGWCTSCTCCYLSRLAFTSLPDGSLPYWGSCWTRDPPGGRYPCGHLWGAASHPHNMSEVPCDPPQGCHPYFMSVNVVRVGGESPDRRPGYVFPGSDLCAPIHLLPPPEPYGPQHSSLKPQLFTSPCWLITCIWRDYWLAPVNLHRGGEGMGLCGACVHGTCPVRASGRGTTLCARLSVPPDALPQGLRPPQILLWLAPPGLTTFMN